MALFLACLVAILTFGAHYRLPYKRMLVLTGVMLGEVLVVMVGENVQELQQAHWCSTTDLHVNFPDWMGTWFAVFNNWETIGTRRSRSCSSSAATTWPGTFHRQGTPAAATAEKCILPDCEQCELPHAHSTGE